MLASPILSAVSTVAIKRWGEGVHPVSLSAVPMGMTAVVMGAVALATERNRPMTLDATSVGALVYLAVFGSAVTFWADAGRTAEELRARSAEDAAAYPTFDRKVRAIASFLAYVAVATPPDPKSPSLADAIMGLKLGKAFRDLGGKTGREAIRALPMAVADLVQEVFESEAVRGPLVMLYRKALALDEAHAMIERFRAWIDTEGWCEIEVDAAFRIRRAGRRGLAMLGVAVPEAAIPWCGAALPSTLVAWLTRARADGPAGTALTLDVGARRFALRALPAVEGEGWLVYVGEKAPAEVVDPSASGTLSRREREVLDWVAAGKSDAQAAAILGISVRTVHKHLEHIYEKLGVEGRTAAVMRALGAALH